MGNKADLVAKWEQMCTDTAVRPMLQPMIALPMALPAASAVDGMVLEDAGGTGAQ